MKILSSFTRPHVVTNLYEFLSYVEHKRRYFEEPNSCWSPLTSIVGKEILWKSVGTINCLIRKERKGPILGICALHLTHPCTHTQQWVVNKHTLTHTPWTHTQSSGQPFMLRRPGSSWGFGALLKGLTSVVVLKVERALDIHSPDLWVTSPTLYPLGHDCPKKLCFCFLKKCWFYYQHSSKYLILCST